LVSFRVNDGYKSVWITTINGQTKIAEMNYISVPLSKGFVYLGSDIMDASNPCNLKGAEEGTDTQSNYSENIWKEASLKDVHVPEVAKKPELTKEDIPDCDDENYWFRELIQYIGSGFYIRRQANGFQFVGGNGRGFTENADIAPLEEKKMSYLLKDYLGAAELQKVSQKLAAQFKADFISEDDEAEVRKTCEAAAVEASQPNVISFELERKNGLTQLIARSDSTLDCVNAQGATNLADEYSKTPIGPAPKSLIQYNSFPLDYAQLQKLEPKLKDAFVSPNQNILFLLTDKEVIGVDVVSGKEMFRNSPSALQQKDEYGGVADAGVVMVEWATGDAVNRWTNAIVSPAK
jgi:hypothetical protein